VTGRPGGAQQFYSLRTKKKRTIGWRNNGKRASAESEDLSECSQGGASVPDNAEWTKQSPTKRQQEELRQSRSRSRECAHQTE
jgi:hypothetical protein